MAKVGIELGLVAFIPTSSQPGMFQTFAEKSCVEYLSVVKLNCQSHCGEENILKCVQNLKKESCKFIGKIYIIYKSQSRKCVLKFSPSMAFFKELENEASFNKG